jgi:hypothetical protein
MLMANHFPSASVDLVKRSNDQLMAGKMAPRQWSASLDQQRLNEMLKSAHAKITNRSQGSSRPCH